MSSNKNKFEASFLSADETGGVGVLSEDDGFSPSEDRLEHLAKLLQDGSAPPLETDNKEEDRIMKLFPASKEKNIKRNLLDPAPDEWNFFGKPSPSSYALIVQSIYKYGLWHPLTVWEEDDGRYMILGGHTRNAALDDLYKITKDRKYLSAPCRVYAKDSISMTTARRIVILSNLAQRAQERVRTRVRCYAEMAKLEQEESFYASKRIDVGAAVAKMFGVSRRQVFMYRSLERLYPSIMDELEQGGITLSTAYLVSRLPQDTQAYLAEKGYFRDVSQSNIKLLRNAENHAEIDRIFGNFDSSRPKFRYGVMLPVKKPEGFGVFPLLVKDGEADSVKEFLRKSLEGEEGKSLSDETRAAIGRLLDG